MVLVMKRLINILILSMLIGCSTGRDISDISTKPKDIKIYFYYSKSCPNCLIIKPYINLLIKEVKGVKFDICATNNLKSCSNESLKMMQRINLRGVPTAVLLVGDNPTVFLGWKEVARIGKCLNGLGIETPKVVYGNVSYNVQECLDCHKRRNLGPPSMFNCTQCCHIQK